MDRNEQDQPPRNNRRYPRYEMDTELIAAMLGVERRELRGRSLNINEGGIAGVFAKQMDVGIPVTLQFFLPVVASPVRVQGVVRNRTSYRYGFEFVDLTPEQRETISRTCRTLGLLQ
jgi:c-di-GMP-binding flagellar brake protein YcgR